MGWKEVNEKKAREKAVVEECDALKDYNAGLRKKEQETLNAMVQRIIPYLPQFHKVKAWPIQPDRTCLQCDVPLVMKVDGSYWCPDCGAGPFLTNVLDFVYPRCPVCRRILHICEPKGRETFNGYTCGHCGYKVEKTPYGPKLILPETYF